jgi:hypothetical protein
MFIFEFDYVDYAFIRHVLFNLNLLKKSSQNLVSEAEVSTPLLLSPAAGNNSEPAIHQQTYLSEGPVKLSLSLII